MTVQVSPALAGLGGSRSPDDSVTSPVTYRTAYLANLQRLAAAQASTGPAVAWLAQLRSQAAAHLSELSLPTTHDEDWRFTDLSALLEVTIAGAGELAQPLAADAITPLGLPESSTSQLVFINGHYQAAASNLTGLPTGVFVGNLAAALQHPELSAQLPNYLGGVAGSREVFAALNTIGLADAAIIWIPKNCVITTPIHCLFITVPQAQPQLIQPRCLVVAEAGSAVTLVESYRQATGETPIFTNSVTEIWLGENAQMEHSRIQWQSATAFQVGKTVVSQAKDSRYTNHAINLESQIGRHTLTIAQTGEQTETTLNGLTIAAGEECLDTHTAVDLSFPYSRVRQLQKCIVADRGHAVFNGAIIVGQKAQQTDAGQLSRNLLLSPKARVDTKPQLEIIADNVKCTHGATVSQLEADEIFYLQSRGLDREMAQKLLVDAFAAEVINQLPLTSLQKQLTQAVKAEVNL
ncbi:Fe-S cluster assembly protein SufD [Trichothermofontia sichuanensis B231]|uniref:Fe-S cluster assembly protein SufD n=1 Tax=Trichothermofontia sichuanensis TaxID=3045816 RepID=UPI00224592E8|nr:Fe-S cluster assembly protein SufD [Trichothermofontia sichuanensis]UZQ53229.1 Fe-S cluster assembly protein SufD [Trichothermofontia sichuanensis B231]